MGPVAVVMAIGIKQIKFHTIKTYYPKSMIIIRQSIQLPLISDHFTSPNSFPSSQLNSMGRIPTETPSTVITYKNQIARQSYSNMQIHYRTQNHFNYPDLLQKLSRLIGAKKYKNQLNYSQLNKRQTISILIQSMYMRFKPLQITIDDEKLKKIEIYYGIVGEQRVVTYQKQMDELLNLMQQNQVRKAQLQNYKLFDSALKQTMTPPKIQQIPYIRPYIFIPLNIPGMNAFSHFKERNLQNLQLVNFQSQNKVRINLISTDDHVKQVETKNISLQSYINQSNTLQSVCTSLQFFVISTCGAQSLKVQLLTGTTILLAVFQSGQRQRVIPAMLEKYCTTQFWNPVRKSHQRLTNLKVSKKKSF